MLEILRKQAIKLAHDRADEMDIHQLTDVWPAQNRGLKAHAERSTMIIFCSGMILAAVVSLLGMIIPDTVTSDYPPVAIFLGGAFAVGAIIFYKTHHYEREKQALIAAARKRLATSPELHEEYLACVERSGAVRTAALQVAAAAQQARNAALEGQLVTAQLKAAREDEASRLTSWDRARLDQEIRHNTSMAEMARKSGSSAGDFEGRAAAAAAKLAGGRK